MNRSALRYFMTSFVSAPRNCKFNVHACHHEHKRQWKLNEINHRLLYHFILFLFQNAHNKTLRSIWEFISEALGNVTVWRKMVKNILNRTRSNFNIGVYSNVRSHKNGESLVVKRFSEIFCLHFDFLTSIGFENESKWDL